MIQVSTVENGPSFAIPQSFPEMTFQADCSTSLPRLPYPHLRTFLSLAPTYRSLWLLSAERSLEERSPLGVSESWRREGKVGSRKQCDPSAPLFFTSPYFTITPKASLPLTSPRSKLSQFSEVKGRISRSKSKYFFLQQTLR